MKLNELIKSFEVHINNEEAALLEKLDGVQPYEMFIEREQFVLDSLIRKSLVTKINHRGTIMVAKNESYS